MECLFIYNKSSGNHKIIKKVDFINEKLKEQFSSVTIYESKDALDYKTYIENNASNYDVLIFSGGDGTFNMTVNALMHVKKKPIIGLIPTGTLNDASKNYGYTKNIKKSLKIIKNMKTKSLPLVKANDKYFAFSASLGAYSNIPEVTKNDKKALFGKFAYYFRAVPMMFKKKVVTGKIILPTETIDYKTNFIMILNSAYMGGFKINKRFKSEDNKFDIVFSKAKPFNGLLNYFIFKRNVSRISTSHATIIPNENDTWDMDGERTNEKKVELAFLPEILQILVK